MRICRVSQTYPTTQNQGKGQHAFFNSKYIVKDTIVLTKKYNEDYIKNESHVRLFPINYFQFPFERNQSKNFHFLISSISYIIGQLQFFIKSLPILVKFKPSIVHLQSPHGILISLFCKLFYSSKIFLTFHGSDLRRLNSNKYLMLLLNKVDKVFYVSRFMEPDLKNHFGESKIFFTPSGIDIDYFLINKKYKRKNYVLCVANLLEEKGIEFLIDAFHGLLKTNPEYKLVLVYSSFTKKYRSMLINKIKMLHIDKNIIMLKNLSRSEIRDYYQKSKLFVLPSLAEGMPKVIHEAKASKLPIIATDVGSCKEIVNDSGFIVQPGSSTEILNKILILINNQDIYRKFQNNSHSDIYKYSWKYLAKNIFEQFKKIYY